MIIYAHLNIELVKDMPHATVAVMQVSAALFFVSADAEAEKFYNNDSKGFSSSISASTLGDITLEYEKYLSRNGFIPGGPSVHGKGFCYYKKLK